MAKTLRDRLLDLPVSTVVAVVIGIAYFTASRGVQNFFPFSALDMYAGSGARTATRLLAVDASGRALQLDQFDQWSCDRKLDADAIACPEQGDVRALAYVNRDLVSYIDQHQGAPVAGESLLLVRRVWKLEDTPGPPPHSDCAVARCVARRR
jgi:hypothetical protein